MHKKPLCKWGSLATDDERLAQELWRQAPGPLVGVVTGVLSGIALLDLDIDRHSEAQAWLAEHGRRLPATRVHRSRSGSLHFLYRCTTSKLRSRNGSSKGPTVASWSGGPGLGGSVARDLAYAPWPQWLTEMFWPPAPRIEYRPAPIRTDRRDIRVRIDGLVGVVERAMEGERHLCLHWSARRVVDMEKAGEISRPEYSIAMDALAMAAHFRGLDLRDINRTLASVGGPR